MSHRGDHLSTDWPRVRSADDLELGYRFAALQVGYWLGWASILVVIFGLALDVAVRDRWLVVAFTLAAAAGNTAAMLIPWRAWLATRRGRVLLDLWCGGLIAFVAMLVIAAGSNFALLLFLAVPFIAVVQVGWRRGIWLTAGAGTCSGVAALLPLSVGATAMRLALVAAVAAVTLVLVRTIRREATAHRLAATRADLEHTLVQEASHRIKNDLQTAADLLLLGRPDGPEGVRFDETAARIRSIATVHDLLSEAGDHVDAGALLRGIAADTPGQVTVDAEPGSFDAATAQKLGLVANELITNAFQHGSPPILVRLQCGVENRLLVEDDGGRGAGQVAGFGLELVRSMVERGLNGRFELAMPNAGRTRAEVVFPAVTR